MKSEIVSQASGWYVILCLLCGVAFAGLFYWRASAFSRDQRWVLALLRGSLASALAFLLLNPLIKTLTSLVLKPKVVLLLDHSRSMKGQVSTSELGDAWTALRKYLEDKGFETEVKNLEDVRIEEVKDLAFTARKTNLSQGLNAVKSSNEGQHLTDVILVSDGILNDGLSPTFFKYPFRIHAVGAGDSTLKKDASISGVAANKIAYLGNDFTVNIDVSAVQMAGSRASLDIRDSEGTVLQSQSVSYTSEDSFTTLQFKLPARKIGKQRFVAQLQVLNGEHMTQNNRREFIVDVVNGKEKILLLAAAPHPDLKAIKSILDKNEWFDLTIKIIQESDISQIKSEVYDVLILHQFPDQGQMHTRFLGELLARQKPVFFFPGSRPDWSYFNGMQNVVSVQTQLGKADKVSGQLNPGFSLFQVPSAQVLAELPPISVPFGNYTALTGTDVLMTQYISGIATGRPLLAVNLGGSRKMAVFLGDGLWNWRMEEYAQTQMHEVLDDLILKTLQLIAIKEDKGKLRVYPTNDVFLLDQRVSFVVEVYNDLYERVYDQDIQLKIKDEKGVEKAYDFRITTENARFELSTLPAGVYGYEAKLKGRDEVSSGEFVVSDVDVELQNTSADFGLLRTIASENEGKFVKAEHLFELRNVIQKDTVSNKLIGKEDIKDIIHFWWLWIILLVLASTEWILRKYWGAY
jgi:hypothetical protein